MTHPNREKTTPKKLNLWILIALSTLNSTTKATQANNDDDKKSDSSHTQILPKPIDKSNNQIITLDIIELSHLAGQNQDKTQGKNALKKLIHIYTDPNTNDLLITEGALESIITLATTSQYLDTRKNALQHLIDIYGNTKNPIIKQETLQSIATIAIKNEYLLPRRTALQHLIDIYDDTKDPIIKQEILQGIATSAAIAQKSNTPKVKQNALDCLIEIYNKNKNNNPKLDTTILLNIVDILRATNRNQVTAQDLKQLIRIYRDVNIKPNTQKQILDIILKVALRKNNHQQRNQNDPVKQTALTLIISTYRDLKDPNIHALITKEDIDSISLIATKSPPQAKENALECLRNIYEKNKNPNTATKALFNLVDISIRQQQIILTKDDLNLLAHITKNHKDPYTSAKALHKITNIALSRKHQKGLSKNAINHLINITINPDLNHPETRTIALKNILNVALAQNLISTSQQAAAGLIKIYTNTQQPNATNIKKATLANILGTAVKSTHLQVSQEITSGLMHLYGTTKNPTTKQETLTTIIDIAIGSRFEEIRQLTRKFLITLLQEPKKIEIDILDKFLQTATTSNIDLLRTNALSALIEISSTKDPNLTKKALHHIIHLSLNSEHDNIAQQAITAQQNIIASHQDDPKITIQNISIILHIALQSHPQAQKTAIKGLIHIYHNNDLEPNPRAKALQHISHIALDKHHPANTDALNTLIQLHQHQHIHNIITTQQINNINHIALQSKDPTTAKDAALCLIGIYKNRNIHNNIKKETLPHINHIALNKQHPATQDALQCLINIYHDSPNHNTTKQALRNIRTVALNKEHPATQDALNTLINIHKHNHLQHIITKQNITTLSTIALQSKDPTTAKDAALCLINIHKNRNITTHIKKEVLNQLITIALNNQHQKNQNVLNHLIKIGNNNNIHRNTKNQILPSIINIALNNQHQGSLQALNALIDIQKDDNTHPTLRKQALATIGNIALNNQHQGSQQASTCLLSIHKNDQLQHIIVKKDLHNIRHITLNPNDPQNQPIEKALNTLKEIIKNHNLQPNIRKEALHSIVQILLQHQDNQHQDEHTNLLIDIINNTKIHLSIRNIALDTIKNTALTNKKQINQKALNLLIQLHKSPQIDPNIKAQALHHTTHLSLNSEQPQITQQVNQYLNNLTNNTQNNPNITPENLHTLQHIALESQEQVCQNALSTLIHIHMNTKAATNQAKALDIIVHIALTTNQPTTKQQALGHIITVITNAQQQHQQHTIPPILQKITTSALNKHKQDILTTLLQHPHLNPSTKTETLNHIRNTILSSTTSPQATQNALEILIQLTQTKENNMLPHTAALSNIAYIAVKSPEETTSTEATNVLINIAQDPKRPLETRRTALRHIGNIALASQRPQITTTTILCLIKSYQQPQIHTPITSQENLRIINKSAMIQHQHLGTSISAVDGLIKIIENPSIHINIRTKALQHIRNIAFTSHNHTITNNAVTCLIKTYKEPQMCSQRKKETLIQDIHNLTNIALNNPHQPTRQQALLLPLEIYQDTSHTQYPEIDNSTTQRTLDTILQSILQHNNPHAITALIEIYKNQHIPLHIKKQTINTILHQQNSEHNPNALNAIIQIQQATLNSTPEKDLELKNQLLQLITTTITTHANNQVKQNALNILTQITRSNHINLNIRKKTL